MAVSGLARTLLIITTIIIALLAFASFWSNFYIYLSGRSRLRLFQRYVLANSLVRCSSLGFTPHRMCPHDRRRHLRTLRCLFEQYLLPRLLPHLLTRLDRHHDGSWHCRSSCATKVPQQNQ